jgi:manganese/iron transport system substrate-binding protein
MTILRRLILAVGFIAATAPAYAQDDRFKVVTTFTVIADMARNVAGDAAVVESITRPGAEIHEYQPTPRDLVRAQDASISNSGSNAFSPICRTCRVSW